VPVGRVAAAAAAVDNDDEGAPSTASFASGLPELFRVELDAIISERDGY